MTEPTKRTLSGCLSILLGLLTMFIIYKHPERLNAPAWVAYTACLAFVFAGLCIIAAELRLKSIYAWLVVVMTGSMFLPGAWVAFGSGQRSCRLSLPFFNGLASAALCRGVFGLGSLLVFILLIWVIRQALWGKHAN